MYRRALLFIPVVVAGIWLSMRNEAVPPRSAPPPRVPRTAVAAPDAPAWDAIEEAIVATAAMPNGEAALVAVRRALAPEGPPADADLGAWRPYALPIAAIERALARPGLSLPDDGAGDDLLLLQHAAHALEARGWDRARAGSPEAGATDMLGALALGNRVVDAAEDARPLAIGLGVRHGALRELGELLDWSADPEALSVALAGLLGHGPARGAMARVLAHTCEMDKGYLASDLAKPGAILTTLNLDGPVAQWGLPPTLSNTVVGAVLYDQAGTRALMDTRCATLAEQLALPPAGRRHHAEDPPPDWSVLRNPVGRTAVSRQDYELGLAEKEDRLRAAQAVLTTAAAARLYLGERGRVPATVAELVPAWLPAVPVDPYRAGGVTIVGTEVRSAAPTVPSDAVALRTTITL